MCEHNTTIVKYDQGNVQVEVCTWGCGQTIISVKRADAVTESFTAAELSALRERVEALERVEKVAREITAVVESAAVVRLAKPCKHGNYATAPYNHAWFCDECWIEMQNALAALQAP